MVMDFILQLPTYHHHHHHHHHHRYSLGMAPIYEHLMDWSGAFEPFKSC